MIMIRFKGYLYITSGILIFATGFFSCIGVIIYDSIFEENYIRWIDLGVALMACVAYAVSCKIVENGKKILKEIKIETN